jgi:hypothetical protein
VVTLLSGGAKRCKLVATPDYNRCVWYRPTARRKVPNMKLFLLLFGVAIGHSMGAFAQQTAKGNDKEESLVEVPLPLEVLLASREPQVG